MGNQMRKIYCKIKHMWNIVVFKRLCMNRRMKEKNIGVKEICYTYADVLTYHHYHNIGMLNNNKL